MLRSSSYGSHDLCEMQYFLDYELGLPSITNVKTVLGSITHKVLQILAQGTKDKSNIVNDEDIGEVDISEPGIILDKVFNYFVEQNSHLIFERKEYRACVSLLDTALNYLDGIFDPRNQNIFEVEKWFDIELKYDWAKYSYNIDGKPVEGYLKLMGHIDLINIIDDVTLHVVDYKTGQRKNWVTGNMKTYNELRNNHQIRMYDLVLHELYPEYPYRMIDLYYINDGGLFSYSFNDDDRKQTLKMLKKKFEDIKNMKVPHRIKPHFFCNKICSYGKNSTVCDEIYQLIKKDGLKQVYNNYADKDRIFRYGTGGRI